MLSKKLKMNSENPECNVVYGQKTSSVPINSIYFKPQFWQKVYEIECEMNLKYKKLVFTAPVAAVYNPVEYASELHCSFMQKFLSGPKKILFVGMNPGPFGMCQTGVPFGSIPAVRDWMKLSGTVTAPDLQIPNRPVEGLNCKRIEESGKRFWSLFQKICIEPENFFENCFVYNVCSLAFFKSSGANITPAELKGEVKKSLQNICLDGLVQIIALFAPEKIICIGNYIRDRVRELEKLNRIDSNIELLCIPHPSPRSLNNTNWNEKAEKWLNDNNIIQFLTK